MGVPADVDAAPVVNQLVLPDDTVELVERMLTRMKVYIHRRPDDLQRHYYKKEDGHLYARTSDWPEQLVLRASDPTLTTLMSENQVTYVSEKGRILTPLLSLR